MLLAHCLFDSVIEVDVRGQPNTADNWPFGLRKSVQAQRIRQPARLLVQLQRLDPPVSQYQAQFAPAPNRAKRFPSNRCVQFSLDWREWIESQLPIDSGPCARMQQPTADVSRLRQSSIATKESCPADPAAQTCHRWCNVLRVALHSAVRAQANRELPAPAASIALTAQ